MQQLYRDDKYEAPLLFNCHREFSVADGPVRIIIFMHKNKNITGRNSGTFLQIVSDTGI